MLQDATVATRDEAAEVLACLREALRESAFAKTLALLVSGNGQDEHSEIVERIALGASGAGRNDS